MLQHEPLASTLYWRGRQGRRVWVPPPTHTYTHTKSLYLILCRLLRQRGLYDKKNSWRESNIFYWNEKFVGRKKWNRLLIGDWSAKSAKLILFGRKMRRHCGKRVFLVERTVNSYNTQWVFYSRKLFGLRACGENHKLQCEQFAIGNDVLVHSISWKSIENLQGRFRPDECTDKELKALQWAW